VAKVKDVVGREVYDSRGNPTVECDLVLDDASIGRFSVPSGASTGVKEAAELRDGGERIEGMGVQKAVVHINTEIRNEVKGGLLIEKVQTGSVLTLVSLEIFKNKTKVTPIVDDKHIEINISVETTVAIDEIGGTENFIDDEGRMKLEESAENMLKKRIESLINKIQSEYDADILGFGTKLQEDKAQVWNRVHNNWEDIFKELKVNVKTIVHIRNSGTLSKPLEKGD